MKTSNVGHIIHKHNGVYIPIVVLHHALSEALLSCCIPQLDLDALPVDGDGALAEVHADGGLRALREAAGAEAVGQARFAHVRVPDHDDLEDAGARGGQPAGAHAGVAQLQRRVQLGRRLHPPPEGPDGRDRARRPLPAARAR